MTIALTAFLADGVTPAVGTNLTECEKVFFRATLSWAGAPNAAFEGGTWTLTTPDGVVNNVTPVGGIPCIGGTANDPAAPGGRGQTCLGGPLSINSALVMYTVRPQDIVGGLVMAMTNLSGAFAHIGANDLAGVGAATPLSLAVVPCDDNLFCSPEICDPNAIFGEFGERRGTCVAQANPCPDNLFCSVVACNEAIDQCVTGPDPNACPPGTACADISCNEATDRCDSTDTSGRCGESDACVDRGCDPATGCFTNDRSAECGSDETCVDRGCDPETGCFERDPEPLPAECGEFLGCRITAGGITPDGQMDTGALADILRATFGGQVGAPCGCIGCFDEFDHIQGNWTHSRKSRRGSFHAKDYNSLICGCDGVFDGELCNPGDREPGPEPRPAPANMACFSGIGDFNPTSGRRAVAVAFRVEVEDRSEPAVGKLQPDDVYRIRIWIPGPGETPAALADQACCTNSSPTGRAPDVDDGGVIIHGNIQIHPVLPNTEQGTCPVPNGSCQQ